MAATYDVYVIGDQRGFYVGQAKHTARGGAERRIAEHRSGKSGVLAAHELLSAGKSVLRLGPFTCAPGYANFLEARLWDTLKAQGWKPVHARPKDTEFWATCGGTYTPDHADKIRKALTGKKWTAERKAKHRQLLSRRKRASGMLGKKHSPETRARMAAAHRGRPKSDAMRQRMSVVAQNRSAEHRERLGKAARKNQLGKKLSLETRLKMSEAQRKAWSTRRLHAHQ